MKKITNEVYSMLLKSVQIVSWIAELAVLIICLIADVSLLDWAIQHAVIVLISSAITWVFKWKLNKCVKEKSKEEVEP